MSEVAEAEGAVPPPNPTTHAADIDRAAAAFRRAVDAVERTDDRDLEFAVVMSAAAVFAEAGAVEEALQEIDRIAPGNTPSQRGRLLTQRSYVLHHAGRLGEAIAQLDRAEPEFRESDDDLGWLRLLVNRGLIRLQQGEFDLAERDLREADLVATRLGQAAMRAGLFGSRDSDANVNRQAPAITKQFVLIPAGLFRSSRSTPIIAPSTRHMRSRNSNAPSFPTSS